MIIFMYVCMSKHGERTGWRRTEIHRTGRERRIHHIKHNERQEMT